MWFAVNFPGESQTVRVRQYARLQGGSWTTRDVNLSGSSWYDVALSPTTVDAGRTSYVVEAKQDWIDGSGKVLKSGAVKTFYFPVRPKVNRYQVTMYGVTGSVAAKRGAANSGTLYAGQRVRPYYTYTSGHELDVQQPFPGIAVPMDKRRMENRDILQRRLRFIFEQYRHPKRRVPCQVQQFGLVHSAGQQCQYERRQPRAG